MRLSYPEFVLLACACLPSLLDMDATAATYVDPQNQVTLTVTPTPSAASGHVAWRFNVTPTDAMHEVSSIDAATGTYGFSGVDLRQVNPAGQPTIFTDFNVFFPAGEDETSDSQFAFNRSDLILAPGSELEDSNALEAAFTGFPAIRVDSASHAFAQIVLPTEGVGTFHGAFALRPTEGGLAQLVEFGPISFSVTPGDFDFDGDVDGGGFSHLAARIWCQL